MLDKICKANSEIYKMDQMPQNNKHQLKNRLIMAHTACIVCPVSTISGNQKIPLEEQVQAAGTQNKT